MGDKAKGKGDKEKEAEKEGPGIWQEILSTSRSKDTVLAIRDAIFMGDPGCGKTALIARLKKLEYDEVFRGMVLDYSYLNIMEEDGEDTHLAGRLNLWQMGDHHFSNLLDIPVRAETIDKTAFVICVDVSQPWLVIPTVETWIGAIKKLLAALKLTDEKKEALRADLRSFILSLQERPAAPKAAEPTEPVEGAGVSDAPPAPAPAATPAAEATLPEGALKENLGVRMVVVVTKADQIGTVQQNLAFKDAHFDYIQSALRDLCLRYGAALVYTSSNDQGNTQLLGDYVRYLLFSGAFKGQADTSVRERIFIPIGWDSASKIAPLETSFASLVKNAKSESGNPKFTEVIREPFQLKTDAGAAAVVTCEDDQEFLKRFKDLIANEPDHGMDASDAATKNVLSQLFNVDPKKKTDAKAAGGDKKNPLNKRNSLENLLGVARRPTGSDSAGAKQPADKSKAMDYFMLLAGSKKPAAGAPSSGESLTRTDAPLTRGDSGLGSEVAAAMRAAESGSEATTPRNASGTASPTVLGTIAEATPPAAAAPAPAEPAAAPAPEANA